MKQPSHMWQRQQSVYLGRGMKGKLGFTWRVTVWIYKGNRNQGCNWYAENCYLQDVDVLNGEETDKTQCCEEREGEKCFIY